MTQQHAAAAGFGALANDDLNRVRLAQIIGVHAVARRQVLIDQLVGMAALFRRHAAIAGGGGGARGSCTAPQGFFRWTGQRPKGHARDGDRDIQLDRVFGVQAADGHVRLAFLAIPFERVARNRRAHEQQVVK